jgi:cell division protein FtsL
MRLLNVLVIAALVMAAAYVYRIKFQSTLQAEQVAKLRSEVRRERDAVAALRAQWAKLDNPARIQGLAQRHLKLQPIASTQFDRFDHLPERPQPVATQGDNDPIAAILEMITPPAPPVTGSIPKAGKAK